MSKINSWKRVEQWVSRVIEFSSEHHREFWAAQQIIGSPKVYPQYGQIPGGWAQGEMSDNEFIIVEFATNVFPDEIQIFETFNSGGIVKVSIRKFSSRNFLDEGKSSWKTIWQRDEPILHPQTRIFVVRGDELRSSNEINQIRLDINCRAACNACHIDSVKLIGFISQLETSLKKIQSNLNDLLHNEIFPPDVSFELADGKILRSYRNFLSARSIYFRQLFAENQSKSNEPIRIDRISSRSFNEILRFLFTKTIKSKLHYEILLELLRRIDEFYLGEMYDVILRTLRKQINVKNSFSILLYAYFPNQNDEIRLDDVVKICQKFILKNRQNVFQVEQFQQIDKTIFTEFLLLVTAND